MTAIPIATAHVTNGPIAYPIKAAINRIVPISVDVIINNDSGKTSKSNAAKKQTSVGL